MSALRLKSVKYEERVGHPKEWTLDGLTLGQINLIVGTNATGKTRVLNIIGNLARMFVPEPRYITANGGYDLLFEDDGHPLRYVLQKEDGKTTKEEVSIDSKKLLSRGTDGEGEIYAEVEGRNIRFKPPENELAAVIRRDSLQHPYLEPLHEWASSVRHYRFGTPLGQNHLAVLLKNGPQVDERDANLVVGIFHKAKLSIGPPFVEAIIHDMSRLGCISQTDKIKARGPVPSR